MPGKNTLAYFAAMSGTRKMVLCRVQMPAKMFPHLKLLSWLFMGPTLDFDKKQRNSFFDQIWYFLQ
jgi:hypothetical protein